MMEEATRKTMRGFYWLIEGLLAGCPRPGGRGRSNPFERSKEILTEENNQLDDDLTWLKVKPYRSDAGLSQFWVVPVVGKNNYPLALLTFFYTPQSHLIQEGEFDAVTNDMFYVNHPFPAVTLNRAVAAVHAEQHALAVQGRAPELIYFPGDFAGLKSGRQNWHGGGTAVIDPIWRVPGVDGKWHYVAHDGHTHLSTELPVDPAYPPMASTTAIQ
jgi:hypothetical protein